MIHAHFQNWFTLKTYQLIHSYRFHREKESAELREKLEKSREKRILNSKVSGNTLGEAKGKEEDEFLSAADWVKRSRKKEKEVISEKDKSKLQAELASKRLEEEEEESMRNGSKYNSSHLKGLQVMHSAKDFDIGLDVILTLADSDILEKDEDGHVLGVTEDVDFLENVNMTDTDRRLDREKRAKRLKQPVRTLLLLFFCMCFQFFAPFFLVCLFCFVNNRIAVFISAIMSSQISSCFVLPYFASSCLFVFCLV